MRPEDIRTLPEGSIVDTPVCIVGAGPAGLTVARELSDHGRQALLLESGDRVSTPWNDALNEIESIGAARVMDQALVRNRVLGGSSTTWWGRVAAFDAMDFRRRPWVTDSGWPIDREEVVPYLARAVPHLGSAIPDNTAPDALRLLGDDRMALSEDAFVRYLWTYSRDAAHGGDVMRFGRRALADDLPGVRCYTSATVTHIDTDPAGRTVRGLEVHGPDGRRRLIRTPRVVLCAGGIENARLLLISDRSAPAGLGNGHDLVGRFLMDHLRGPVGSFRPPGFAALQSRVGPFDAETAAGRTRVVPGWALAPRLQQAEELLNCALWIEGEVAEADPLRSLAAFAHARQPLRNARNVLRRAPSAARSSVAMARRRPGVVRMMSAMTLQCIVEQRPDPASRVTLSARRDAFGVPLTVVDWRVHDEEARTVRRASALFAAELRRSRLPEPDLLPMVLDPAEPFSLPDVAHPTGTTRMSADASTGVVDTDCAVHGVDGLYVAGSSVFPTSGHANPTQMIVALAVRLADHLRDTWMPAPPLQATGEPARSASSASEHASTNPLEVGSALGVPPAPESRPTVLLTGATGSVGRHLLPRLVQEGFAVRALTSRIPAGPVDGVEWRVHDLRQLDLDFRSDAAGCAAILHLAVEQREPDDMLRVNAEATGALARAAEQAGVRFMCYTSSVSVYGSPIAPVVHEDAPVLTTARDVSSQYWARPALRAYGRTKLLGERAIEEVADRVEYVVFRPTVIADRRWIRERFTMSSLSRAAAWTQRTHAVNVSDVVEAILWSLNRALERAAPRPGITVYNLSDETEHQTYGQMFRANRGLERLWRVPPIPAAAIRALKWLQYGQRFPVRRPQGFASYPATRLYRDGYRHRHGLEPLLDHAGDARSSGPEAPMEPEATAHHDG